MGKEGNGDMVGLHMKMEEHANVSGGKIAMLEEQLVKHRQVMAQMQEM